MKSVLNILVKVKKVGYVMLFLMAAFGIYATPAHAAPTFDNALLVGSQDASVSTQSFTVADQPNRVLYVAIRTSSVNVNSVTYGGVAMTEIDSVNYGNIGYLYRLVAPTVGANDVVVTFSALTSTHYAIASYYDVDQSTPNSTPNDVSGNNDDPQITITSAAGETVVGFVIHDSSNTMVAGSGDNLRIGSLGRVKILDEAGASPSVVLGGTNTMSSAVDWGFIGLSLKPAVSTFPVVESVTETTFASDSTTHNVTMPATVEAGDLLLTLFSSDGDATANTPSGWTSIGTATRSTFARGSVFAKVAVGNEGGTTVNFSTSTSENGAAEVYRITNWYGSIADGVAAGSADPGGTTNVPNPPSLNPASWDVEDTLWIAYAAGSSWSSVSSYPTNYTDGSHALSGTGTANSSASSARRELSASSDDPGAFSMGSTSSGVAFTIAIRPLGNTAPSISAGPSVNYGSYTRTGPGNSPITVSFTATDPEENGANELSYDIRTGAGVSGGSSLASGTFDSGVQEIVNIAHNANGLVDGTNTIYLYVTDGTEASGTNPNTPLYVDGSAPTTAGTISHSPDPVSTASNQYTATFTPDDLRSTSNNEIRYQIRTGTGGGGSLLYPGSNFDTSTDVTLETTGTFTDSGLTNGATRYVRLCDGANNCADFSFTVDTATPPTVATLGESNLRPNDATLRGQANPNGAAATGYFRYWSSDPGSCTDSGGTRVPSSSGTSLGSGEANVAYSENVTGLTPGTTYYYCAIASTGVAGTGSLDTFTAPGGGTCAAVPQNGDYTVATSCVFGGGATTFDGVDKGTGTSNTGLIDIQAGNTLTIAPDQTIAWGSISTGGTMVLFKGGTLRRGAMWVPDNDGDGYPESTGTINQVFSNTQPAGHMRRAAADGIAADCNDESSFVFQDVAELATDSDQDGYYTGSDSVQCVGSTTTASSRTYYRTGESTYDKIKISGGGGAIAGSDCNDNSATLYQTVNVVTDVDQDGYKTSTAAGNQCLGASTTVGGRTYYTSGSGYSWLNSAQVLGSGSTDCQDNPNGAVCAATSGSATATSQTQINVAWGANSSGGSVPSISGYDLRWCSGASCTPSTTITNVTSTYNHTGRTCGTLYRYIVVAKGATGNTDSSILSATTNTCATAPSVTTSAASSITISGATLNSSVNPNGGSTTITYRYGTSNVACASLPSTAGYGSIGSGTSAVSPNADPITGLTPGQIYYFCATATNSEGTINGSVLNFTVMTLADGSNCSGASQCTSGYCYVDNDNDRYAPSSGTSTCRANSQLGGTDCYDSNSNARPGQTSYFTSDRGDGSFDYNCANGTEKEFSGPFTMLYSSYGFYKTKTIPGNICTNNPGTMSTNCPYMGNTTSGTISTEDSVCGSSYRRSQSGCTQSTTHQGEVENISCGSAHRACFTGCTAGTATTQACR